MIILMIDLELNQQKFLNTFYLPITNCQVKDMFNRAVSERLLLTYQLYQ